MESRFMKGRLIWQIILALCLVVSTVWMTAVPAVAGPPPSGIVVTPNSGPTSGGTLVTITGSVGGKTGGPPTFGGLLATVVSQLDVKGGSGSNYVVTTPPHAAGIVDVTVTNDGGTGILVGGYTYIGGAAKPTVTAISTNAGPTAGGTAVTITGTNFIYGAAVTFGGTAATGIVVVSPTTLTCTTPAHAVGLVGVIVTCSGSASDAANIFSYGTTVTGITPSTGPAGGGTTVTITGANYVSGATVTIGGNSCTGVIVDSSTRIRATTPSGTAGAQSVVVTTSGGSGTLTGGFTYIAAPTVTSVSPNSGTTAGGLIVTIRGTNFITGTGNSTVTIGGVPSSGALAGGAPLVVIDNTTQIRIYSSYSLTLGAKDVVVTTAGGSGTLVAGFNYTSAVLALGNISPNYGPPAGGTPVTVKGTWFLNGTTTMTIGGLAATSVVVVDNNTITAITPATTAGAKTVAVTTSGGTVSKTSFYTYLAAPTVTSISSASGSRAGGTAVTITGTNFYSPATVTIDSNSCTGVIVDNTTQIRATTPSGTAGAKDVVVTTDSGSGTLTGGFTYLIPTVTAISPSAGPLAGGSAVTITGSSFVSGATVTIGGTIATGVTVDNATSIRATTPSSLTASAKDVVVTNPDAQFGTLTGGFTYGIPPVITSISPSFVKFGTTTTVTIKGTGFVSGTTVNVQDNTTTPTVTPTQITFTTPSPTSDGFKWVQVTNPAPDNLTAYKMDGFLFMGAPTIGSITPNYTLSTGGTSVTISGGNLWSGVTVKIGDKAATGVTAAVDGSYITCTTPVGTDTQDVTVTNIDGQTVTKAAFFTFAPALPSDIIYTPTPTPTPTSSSARLKTETPAPAIIPQVTAAPPPAVIINADPTTAAPPTTARPTEAPPTTVATKVTPSLPVSPVTPATNWGLIGAIIGAIVIVVVVGVVFMLRGKK